MIKNHPIENKVFQLN